MRFKFNFDIKVSKFIKKFIIADTVLFGGWGFVDPIFSVFIIKEVAGATLVTVGMATAIYWVLKSIIQVPVAIFLDKTDGEKDDFYALIGALALVGVGSLGLTLATQVWHIYLIQAIKAVGFGMYVASWPALFSRHLDKGHYSLDWSLDSTSVGLAIGGAGFLSGIIATAFGYNALFMLTGIFSFVSAGILLSAPDLMFPLAKKDGEALAVKDHTPRNVAK